MNRLRLVALLLAPLEGDVGAFTPPCPFWNNPRTGRTVLFASQLPTIEQLTGDPFMQQVRYGFDLTNELLSRSKSTGYDGTEDGDILTDSLKAQLSHSNGIRGFMVSYLTAEESPADDPNIPLALFDALKEQAEDQEKDLIPLTCMNVIMPTAMITMHKDAQQSANSARTAERGVRILKALLPDYPEVATNAQAILTVASSNSNELDENDSKLVKYWTDFFEKWGYEDQQRQDIAKTMSDLLK